MSGANIGRHIAARHADEMPEEGWSTDEAPKPRKTSAKKEAPKRTPPRTAGIPLAQQLAFPYEILSNVTANRLPQTSMVLHAQAPQCGQAWDNFLRRFPALREKIEQGMIAGDVVALIMAHVPILQVMRAETAAIQAQMATYDGGITSPAAA